MLYGDLTYYEIRDAIKDGYDTIIIPTGCTEQQGPHLTVDFDTWFSFELMKECSEQAYKRYNIKTMVAPIIPFGTASEHINFKYGYVHIPQDFYEHFLYHVFSSFSNQGFRKIIVWRGCGGHYLDNLVSRFNSDYNNICSVEIYPHPFYDVWCKYKSSDIPGGHADSFTTSIALYKHPEKVRKELIVKSNSTEPRWYDPNLDFSEYSENGVIGDPTHASKQLGERLWNEVVERVVELLNVTYKNNKV